jgi:ATP/maltotriose-dependent transcriptional regulator MalT
MAYSNLAQLDMLADDAAGATERGGRAIALAEQLGDVETLVHALTNLGSAELLTPRQDEGLRRLERAIELARGHGFHEHAVRAYTAVACVHVRQHEYAAAADSIERTRRFAAEHEIETFELYILGWRARLALERGDWEAAERDALTVIGRFHASTVVRLPSVVVLALLRARRGEGDADTLLDEAVRFALSTAELQRIGPAVSARAETAWLRGDLDAARPELRDAWEITRRSDDRWGRAQLAWWLWRSGDLAAAPDDAPDSLRLQLAGDWRGAAAAWERLGAPYERALALAQGDDPDAWHDALALLEALGATAAAAAVRRDLRRRGARAIPRGPRQTTRRHPAGLTPGQVRVLALLARGLSNGDIARELFLSPRTVDHHVSAILAKLEVTTRAAAIAAAHDRQLLRQS